MLQLTDFVLEISCQEATNKVQAISQMSPDPFLQVGFGHKTQAVHLVNYIMLPRQHLRTLLIALLLYMYSDVAR